MPAPLQTAVLPTHTPALLQAAVEETARALRSGRLAVIPTETVYGLAAHAFDADAVSRIFALKGRPTHNPLIVHIASIDLARRCAADWPDTADRLARAFWPGPLTLVLPRKPVVPDIVTAGGPTVALRWPAHPFAQALIRHAGFPIAAPSANLSARTSPTTVDHVRRTLDGLVPLIVDGGPCQVGLESTVLDLTARPPRILRPGMVHAEALRSVLDTVSESAPETGGIHRSPGLLDRHYAPLAPLIVRTWLDDHDLNQQLQSVAMPPDFPTDSPRPPVTCILAHTRIPAARNFLRVAVIPHDPEAYARALYAELHRCDELGAQLIVVESLPNTPDWAALTDRLRRASIRTP